MLTNKLLRSIAKTFKPYSTGIIVVGSGAWTKLDETKDLDIEVIIPNFDLLRAIDTTNAGTGKLQKALNDFLSGPLDLVKTLGLPMFSLKFYYQEKNISIRFLKNKLFKNICNLNIARQKEPKSIFQYRSISTKTFDIQRNFSGKTRKFDLQCFQRGEEQIIEVPIVLFDNNGLFYPGQIIDRYLSFPIILYQKNTFCTDNLAKLKEAVILRLALEEKRFKRSQLYLDKCLLRKERIPKKLLLRLRKEAARKTVY